MVLRRARPGTELPPGLATLHLVMTSHESLAAELAVSLNSLSGHGLPPSKISITAQIAQIKRLVEE
jgi:hypothetical protein